jgi:LuxR family maltose regulon positive regulatory protein
MPEKLTPRELDVLRCIIGGATSNAEICKALYIANPTCSTHLHNIFAKFGVSDRTAAVLVAQQKQII